MGPAAKPAKPGAVGHQDVDGGDRHHLGARLAVHVDEHGEEELDAVPLGRGRCCLMGNSRWFPHCCEMLLLC
jgi:hypothetical protein